MGVHESSSDGLRVSSQTRGLYVFYLDDWLLVAESRSLLLVHLSLVLQKVQDLGFLINWKKSSLDPQRLPVYL